MASMSVWPEWAGRAGKWRFLGVKTAILRSAAEKNQPVSKWHKKVLPAVLCGLNGTTTPGPRKRFKSRLTAFKTAI